MEQNNLERKRMEMSLRSNSTFFLLKNGISPILKEQKDISTYIMYFDILDFILNLKACQFKFPCNVVLLLFTILRDGGGTLL